MVTTPVKEVGLTRNQKLAMGAAIISFLVGWFHTGQGLANYKVLGTEYGGFILATGLLFLMILAYNRAIKGSGAGLAFYVTCALVTFLCNLNSFYPNYRSNALIREELRNHRTSLGDLRESIKSRFQDVKLNALAESIRSKSKQLQEQCRQRGFGPMTEQMLSDIEKELGRTMTRLRRGTSQAEWDDCAEKYSKIIENELQAKLSENRYSDKLTDIRGADEYYIIFSKKIDETLTDKADLKIAPDYVEDLIKGYRDACKKATVLVAEERKASAGASERNKEPFSCNQKYSSPSAEIGSFSHTFKSVWETRSDGGTLAVLLICLVIDFIFPLALYTLVRADTKKVEDEFWNNGGKKVSPTSRN